MDPCRISVALRLVQGAVRPVGVVEALILPQHPHRVALVPDQGPGATAGHGRRHRKPARGQPGPGQLYRRPEHRPRPDHPRRRVIVDLSACNGRPGQQWKRAAGTLVNTVSGKCLDDPRFTTPRARLEIYACEKGANQKWELPA
jgi:hypothetical protein